MKSPLKNIKITSYDELLNPEIAKENGEKILHSPTRRHMTLKLPRVRLFSITAPPFRSFPVPAGGSTGRRTARPGPAVDVYKRQVLCS